MTDPDFYVPLAQAAERVGFDSMTVADSICYPEESDSVYPYTPDGSREFLENKPFIEAMILAPVLVAKQAASVAYLTGNRLRLGVGVSPWPDDFQVMDVPWERRGLRTDEAIDIVRGLTSGGYFEYHGEIFDVPSIKINPVPTQPIPILIGGHSDAALRRAVVRGDGWTHAGGDPEELDRMLDRLQKIRAAEGNADTPFEIHVASAEAYTVDGIKRLEDKGVTDVIVGFRNSYDAAPDAEPLEQKIANLETYAESASAYVP